MDVPYADVSHATTVCVCTVCEVFKLSHLHTLLGFCLRVACWFRKSWLHHSSNCFYYAWVGGWQVKKFQDIAYIYICSLSKVAVVTVATSARMWTFHMRTFHMLRLYVYAPFAKCLSYHIFIHAPWATGGLAVVIGKLPLSLPSPRALDPAGLDHSRVHIAFAKVYELPSESLQKCNATSRPLLFCLGLW